MQGKVGGWVFDGVGHLEKRWEGETYGSAIWRQAESDRGGAAQVSANKREREKREKKKVHPLNHQHLLAV
ncbi:hypothetical protein INR49_022153 [Caranx melampygus]|nr:hypothetical protein INR49_022153 [Caranx melampygus]